MIVSVTPIGDLSGTMTPVEVAVRVSEYLAGVGLTRAGRVAGAVLELPSLNGDGPVRYYADSSGLRPGRWLGDRSGEVEPGEVTDATLAAGAVRRAFDPFAGVRVDAGDEVDQLAGLDLARAIAEPATRTQSARVRVVAHGSVTVQ